MRPGTDVHTPIVLGSTEDESPDTVARRAARQSKSVRRLRGVSAPAPGRQGPEPASTTHRPHVGPRSGQLRGTRHPAMGARAARDPKVPVKLATATFGRCGHDWNDHLDEAAGAIAKNPHVGADVVLLHLQMSWAKTLKWAGDRPAWKSGAALEDIALAEQAHHVLSQGQLPLYGGSSTKLHDQSRVNVEMAARGLGPADSVHVPPEVYEATDTGLAYAPVSQAHGLYHIVQCFSSLHCSADQFCTTPGGC